MRMFLQMDGRYSGRSPYCVGAMKIMDLEIFEYENAKLGIDESAADESREIQKQEYPGFNIQCSKCWSFRVCIVDTVEFFFDGAEKSGNVHLDCLDCGNKTIIWEP